MKADFKHILYGGDYNPNQWPEAVWKEDMELFDKARRNSQCIFLGKAPAVRRTV